MEVFLFIEMMIVIQVRALDSCNINELAEVQSCTDGYGSYQDGNDMDQVAVGTICTHKVCDIQRQVECTSGGIWNGKESKQCSEPKFEEREMRKRKKRYKCWIFFECSPTTPPQIDSCSSNPCLNGGTCTNTPDSFTCSCPKIWKGTTCEQVALVCARNPCINHVSCVDGSEIYTCVCKPGWSGQTCNIPVDCGHPGQVDNCDLDVPATTLGHQVTYTCHDDFNMITGDPTRECGTDGLWSGLQPDCIYSKSCQSGPCKNKATCINLLGNFRCLCLEGWTGKTCNIDIQPPVTTYCPDDIRVNATEKTRLVRWLKPTFIDPLGTEVVVESSYQEPEYVFPWGDFDIQYTATKPVNGLQSECVFKIIVRPTPCTSLEPPHNGAILCNNWSPEFGQICKIACRQNYTISPTIKFRTWWICGANGHWSTPLPVPDCSVKVLKSGDVLRYDSDYIDHVFSSCTSLQDTRRLQETYMDQISRSGVSEFCNIYRDGCKAENVLVKCNEI